MAVVLVVIVAVVITVALYIAVAEGRSIGSHSSSGRLI